MNLWQQWHRFSRQVESPEEGRCVLSEAERAALLWGEASTPLGTAFPELLRALPDVGRMRFRVLHPAGSFEVSGRLDEVDANRRTAIGRGAGLELRMLLTRWARIFAVDVKPDLGLRSSLRAFDAHGELLLQADLGPDADYLPYARILSRFLDPRTAWPVDPAPARVAPLLPEGDAPAGQVQKAWAEMRTSADLFILLRRLGLSRRRAFERVEGVYSRRMTRAALADLLQAASLEELPLGLSFGNRGCILAHRGLVERTARAANALCILDPGLRLELDLSKVSAWMVQRPSFRGMRLSLELLDERGEPVGSIRDGRAEHETPDPRWAALLRQS